MILLLIALLLLPTAMMPREELYPVERVEVEARDASIPAGARRAIVITRTGGKSPVKVLNVKAYEKEGEYNTVHVEYILIYHSGDYVVAQRKADFESFEKVWLEVVKNRALFMEDAPKGRRMNLPIRFASKKLKGPIRLRSEVPRRSTIRGMPTSSRL